MVARRSENSHMFLRRIILAILHATVIHGCVIGEASSGKNNQSQASILEYLAKSHYDKVLRPDCGNQPTAVGLDIYLESFGKIEEVNMEFGVYMYIRQTWRDIRLANVTDKILVLNKEYITKLWRPDIYCINARMSDLMSPDTEVHSALFLYPDGSIFYSRSSHIIASCEMDLHRFPADTQYCSLKFGSYGNSDEGLLLKWTNKKITIAQRKLAQFYVARATLSSKMTQYTSGNFTALQATFVMRRSLGYYLIQIYVPCVFLVMLSWIVFWMSPDDGASRLTVGITTILTIVFLLGYTNSMLPKVSYAKGMDWYLMTSFLFIFLTLVECITVEKLARKDAKMKEKCEMKNEKRKYSPGVQVVFTARKDDISRRNDQSVKCIKPNSLSEDDDENTLVQIIDNDRNGRENRHPQQKDWVPSASPGCVSRQNTHSCSKVDYWCRVLFPFCFSLFNFFYWYGYMIKRIEF